MVSNQELKISDLPSQGQIICAPVCHFEGHYLGMKRKLCLGRQQLLRPCGWGPSVRGICALNHSNVGGEKSVTNYVWDEASSITENVNTLSARVTFPVMDPNSGGGG